MSVTLAASALMLGLAGGPHCAVMCGALQAGVAHRPTASASQRALISLHVGRLIGYAAAGALVAASVAALSTIGSASAVLRPMWTLLQVAAVIFGLALMVTGKLPGWLALLSWRRLRLPRPAVIRFVPRVPTEMRAACAGACWAAVPCGLLQSALIVAALANTAAGGAWVMSSFSIGTSVSVFVATSMWARLARSGLTKGGLSLSVRMAGVLLAASATFALFHGFGSALKQAICA